MNSEPRVVPLTGGKFRSDVLGSTGLYVVEFASAWCQPCIALQPILEQIATEYHDELKIGKIDIIEEPAIAREVNVKTTPTLIAFRDGKPTVRLAGRTKRQLMEELQTLLA